jgi:hypothetical protein
MKKNLTRRKMQMTMMKKRKMMKKMKWILKN